MSITINWFIWTFIKVRNSFRVHPHLWIIVMILCKIIIACLRWNSIQQVLCLRWRKNSFVKKNYLNTIPFLPSVFHNYDTFALHFFCFQLIALFIHCFSKITVLYPFSELNFVHLKSIHFVLFFFFHFIEWFAISVRVHIVRCGLQLNADTNHDNETNCWQTEFLAL